MSAAPAFPYEAQAEGPADRSCGAAALCMVYRSFGAPCTQAEVWPHIARPDAFGGGCARAYLLARDALRRGFAALVVQAADPWRLLQRCEASGAVAILNHRLAAETGEGHYAVLVALDADEAVLHDPQLGPSRRLAKDDLLLLWQPRRPASEIAGNVLVALARDPAGGGTCPQCGEALPQAVRCDSCGRVIALRPGGVLGCLTLTCPERTWKRLYCPHCDASWPGSNAYASVKPRAVLLAPTAADREGIGMTPGERQPSVKKQDAAGPAPPDAPLERLLEPEQMQALVDALLNDLPGRRKRPAAEKELWDEWKVGGG